MGPRRAPELALAFSEFLMSITPPSVKGQRDRSETCREYVAKEGVYWIDDACE